MGIKTVRSIIGFTAAAVMLSGGIAAQAAGSYTTKPGDNLSRIAKEIYGAPLKWRLIYESNQDQIKDSNLKDFCRFRRETFPCGICISYLPFER